MAITKAFLLSEAQFAALAPLLQISQDNLTILHRLLVLNESFQSVADSSGRAKNTVYLLYRRAKTKYELLLEGQRSAALASGKVVVGFEVATFIAPSSVLAELRGRLLAVPGANELTNNITTVKPRSRKSV